MTWSHGTGDHCSGESTPKIERELGRRDTGQCRGRDQGFAVQACGRLHASEDFTHMGNCGMCFRLPQALVPMDPTMSAFPLAAVPQGPCYYSKLQREMATASTMNDRTLKEMLTKPTGGKEEDGLTLLGQAQKADGDSIESPVTCMFLGALFTSLKEDLQTVKKDRLRDLKEVRCEVV
ncbi:hypothetical protein NDU88_001939 [Pleurodeles waltl]|uniref:Uncharacterized protein n=1 Tax=Pleurodeles waltl TaxID=8319 RepID=A0AAV7MLS1_PLEWA|nr:hypothetical protein NDU88_001939 [Pleurodeles waltl]